MVSLDLRLSACAEMVTGNGIACDIGTDHAYLAAYLVQSGICRKVIASDINDGPLKYAKQTIDKLGLQDRVSLVKSNGLHNIDSDGITDVIIAGMGAETISYIISEADWLKNGVNLVLQAMTKHHFLREWLYNNGYEIAEEHAAVSENYSYTVMKGVYSGKKRKINMFEAYTGKLDFFNEQSIIYLRNQVQKLKKEGYGQFSTDSGHMIGKQKLKLAQKISEICERNQQ